MTQAFNLALLANNLNTSGQLDATDGLSGAVPVANGGTGATSAATGLSNLGGIGAASYASSTTGGTLKARLSGTTLYLTNDGTNA